MKTAMFIVAVLVMASAAHADSESSDIVGKWTWTRAENNCTEVYLD